MQLSRAANGLPSLQEFDLETPPYDVTIKIRGRNGNPILIQDVLHQLNKNKRLTKQLCEHIYMVGFEWEMGTTFVICLEH